ncbi:uncharacterized protein LOC144163870 [Haemaphysalis longicornis]
MERTLLGGPSDDTLVLAAPYNVRLTPPGLFVNYVFVGAHSPGDAGACDLVITGEPAVSPGNLSKWPGTFTADFSSPSNGQGGTRAGVGVQPGGAADRRPGQAWRLALGGADEDVAYVSSTCTSSTVARATHHLPSPGLVPAHSSNVRVILEDLQTARCEVIQNKMAAPTSVAAVTTWTCRGGRGCPSFHQQAACPHTVGCQE